jgi:ABC-type transport system substrate-binding protein
MVGVARGWDFLFNHTLFTMRINNPINKFVIRMHYNPEKYRERIQELGLTTSIFNYLPMVTDRLFLASQAAEPSGKQLATLTVGSQQQHHELSYKRMNLYPGGQGLF